MDNHNRNASGDRRALTFGNLKSDPLDTPPRTSRLISPRPLRYFSPKTPDNSDAPHTPRAESAPAVGAMSPRIETFTGTVSADATPYHSYGAHQLTQQYLDSFDPFLDDEAAPTPIATQFPRHDSTENINSNSATYASYGTMVHGHVGSTDKVTNIVQRSNSAAASTSAAGSTVLGPRLNPPHSSHLAKLIMKGRTDDPRDPDYGNPGRSRRAQPFAAKIDAAVLPQTHSKVSGTSAMMLTQSTGAHINIEGNAAAFLGGNDVARPQWFKILSSGFVPTLEMAFDSLPFIEAYRGIGPSGGGVVRIVGVPYTVSRSEIVAFLGRNASIMSQPMGTPFNAVHVIMDRHTARAQDAYIEFTRPQEAVWTYNHFERRKLQGRQAKLGDRVVEVELSNQEELMVALFPRAHRVTFNGGLPTVDDRPVFFAPGVQSIGFDGFLQVEEIVLLVKHAEQPFRSPFASKCPIRAYECLISTLHKYPWYAFKLVLARERKLLFDATLCMMRALMSLLRKQAKAHEPFKSLPTIGTLHELAVAALVCPGFSETEKATLVHVLKQAGYEHVTNARGLSLRFGGTNKYSSSMPFHALVLKPGVSDVVMDYYVNLLREATTNVQSMTVAELHRRRASRGQESAFGDVHVSYAQARTLYDIGVVELDTVQDLLARVLPRGGPQVNSTEIPAAPALQ